MSNNLYIKAQAPASDAWVRPSDWLPIDNLVSVGDHKFVGLMAVFPDKPSFWHFNFGQAYTVRIDGVATNYASGVAATGSISFSALSPSTTTSEGFRQAIIEVYPQVAPATAAFTITSTRATAPTNFIPNWIDIRLSFPNIASMFMNGGTRFAQLRRWTWVGTVPAISRALAFNSPYLQEVNENFSTASALNTLYSQSRLPLIIGDITNNVTASMTSMINGWGNKTIGNISSTSATNCASLIAFSPNTQTLGNLNLPAATSFSLASMLSLKTIGTVNIPLVSNLTSSFQLLNIETIGDVTTGPALTNITNIINGNRLLKRFYLSNCTNVTTTTTAFAGCFSLQELYLGGLTRGFTVPPCQMDDAAFAALFNSLGIASGAQTIVITGNITLSAPTLAIATGKGYTITP